MASARFLGVEFDSKLNFKKHCDDIAARTNSRLNVLRVIARAGVDKNILITMAKEKPERCSYDSNGSFIISTGAQLKKFEW